MILLYILLCVVSVILISLVLMQDSKSGLGGLTGGTTMSAFGANTDKVLIKFTGGAGAVFFLLVIFIHIGKKQDRAHQSLMPTSTIEAKKDAPTVVVPTHDLKSDSKAVTPESNKATVDEKEEPKGTSVTIPLKDVKETPAKESNEAPKEAPVKPENK